ncbi:MAG TPA: redox-sensing transcriptional repressor Rex [Spirochaetia bacterium]|nr:redox-sensing transcriptional repressor Rex [Spirochaetia bacterium]
MNGRDPLEAAEHPIPEQTLRRIPLYHQILAEMQVRGEAYVSSRHLAQFFRIDDTQVRKDVSLIGYKGKPKAGYSILGLKKAIEEFLGINYENTAILVGAGRLGSALSQYPGLAEYGLKLVAIFDNDPARTGTVLGTFTILPMESLQRVVRSFDVGIAIICVPKDAAQSVAGRIVSLGIKAIWNFSPTQLTVPSEVIVRNENIALGLAILSHYLKRRKSDDASSARAQVRENPPQQLIDIFSRCQPKREFLVQILEETQHAFGYISRDSIGHIADFLNISREQVVEAAAFYPLFRTEPPARFRISLCRGESCSRKGSDSLRELVERELHIADGETTSDGRFSLEMVPCRGLCSESPNVLINDQSIPAKTPEDLGRYLRGLGGGK